MFSPPESAEILALVRSRMPTLSSLNTGLTHVAVPSKRKQSTLDFSAFEDVQDTNSSTDEVDRYQNFQGTNMPNPILFWKNNEDQFPGLSKLARKYLATPAGSTESERLFSKAGFVVDDERTSLKTGKVEDILFLYGNADKF